MEEQLHLIEPDEPEWVIDDATRAIGRRGIEQARQALRDATAVRTAA
jgi:hypothetical protein